MHQSSDPNQGKTWILLKITKSYCSKEDYTNQVLVAANDLVL
jgi:hypothetical protein